MTLLMNYCTKLKYIKDPKKAINCCHSISWENRSQLEFLVVPKIIFRKFIEKVEKKDKF